MHNDKFAFDFISVSQLKHVLSDSCWPVGVKARRFRPPRDWVDYDEESENDRYDD